jgi:hypothetical protein
VRRVTVEEALDILRELGVVEEERVEGETIEQKFTRVFGTGIQILPPEPKICYACGGTYWWISKYDLHLRCVKCHPPASSEIVAGYVRRG